MEPPSVEAFVKTWVRSGLISQPEYEAIRASAPADACSDAKALAGYLVRIGKLSRFQAGKLLEGVTLGLVLGPFHLLSPIGKGGMGSVFLARDSRTQKLVAIKVLPPKRAKAQERLLARFRREMEISQRVVHPHLTRTLEVGVHLGINYIAMEYIPGKNLHKLVNEQGPLKVPRAARMFSEVALGLEYAHGQGLIHRDLKPSNLMVMPDDHVKVLDLGLALIQGEADTDRTITGGQGYVVGTLDYLAPEQAEDPLKVDSRSDIYSLGCTLYFVLTGSPPFSGGNALQKLLRHRCDPPRPVCEINPSVPASFAVLLTRMLAKKPEHRFQTAAELREALLPWTGEVSGIVPRPVAPPTPAPAAALQANGGMEAAAASAPPVAASPAPPIPLAIVVSPPAPSVPAASPASPPSAPVPPTAEVRPVVVPASQRPAVPATVPLASAIPVAIPVVDSVAPAPVKAVPSGPPATGKMVPSPPPATAKIPPPAAQPPGSPSPALGQPAAIVSTPAPPAPSKPAAAAPPSPPSTGKIGSPAPSPAPSSPPAASAKATPPSPAAGKSPSAPSAPAKSASPVAPTSPAATPNAPILATNPVAAAPQAAVSPAGRQHGAAKGWWAALAGVGTSPSASARSTAPSPATSATPDLQSPAKPVPESTQPAGDRLVAVAEKPEKTPEAEPASPDAAGASPPTDLPFWIDFGLPVASGAVFLLLAWIAGMFLLWRN